MGFVKIFNQTNMWLTTTLVLLVLCQIGRLQTEARFAVFQTNMRPTTTLVLLVLCQISGLQTEARFADCEVGSAKTQHCASECPDGWKPVKRRSCGEDNDMVCCRSPYKSKDPYLPLSRYPMPQRRNALVWRRDSQDEDVIEAPTNRTEKKTQEDVVIHFLDRIKKRRPGYRSKMHCKQYSKYTVEYSHVMPLLPKLVPVRIKMDSCPPSFTPLIVGGTDANPEEFPHMAALGFNRNEDIDYLCGGSLISHNYVLTAAHCTSTRWGPPVVVFLGSRDLYSEDGIVARVEDAVGHPGYRPPSCYHDIALVRLRADFQLSPTLRPACLPSPDTKAQYPGANAVATGWGKLGFGREASLSLKKVTLKVVNNRKCEEYYASDVKTDTLRRGITSRLMCAMGHPDKFQDTCQGDSGGPLQSAVEGTRCLTQVVGITSFGKSCGAGVPGVYTRVAPYVPWIEDIVWPV